MKKILSLSLVLIMIMALVGCVQSGGEPIVDETDIPEVTEDIQGSEIKSTQAVHIVEDFTNETYVNFPEIINMIDYLEIDVDTVEKLSESNRELVFCFLDTST